MEPSGPWDATSQVEQSRGKVRGYELAAISMAMSSPSSSSAAETPGGMRRAFAAPAAASARFSVRASMVKRIGKKDGGAKEMAEEKGDNRRG